MVLKRYFNLVIALLACIISNELVAKQAPWVGTDLNGNNCTGNGQGYGPFDYRTTSDFHKHIVEMRHFTPDMEFLKGGKAGGISPILEIPGNLDYTLRALPNHHRALLTAIRFQLKVYNNIIKERLKTPVECYMLRALNFSPNDSVVFFLYGYYLHKVGHLDKAQEMFENSLEISPNSIKVQYAYALLLIDLKQYDKALYYAKKVYKQGNFHPGLRKKLEKLGVWK